MLTHIKLSINEAKELYSLLAAVSSDSENKAWSKKSMEYFDKIGQLLGRVRLFDGEGTPIQRHRYDIGDTLFAVVDGAHGSPRIKESICTGVVMDKDNIYYKCQLKYSSSVNPVTLNLHENKVSDCMVELINRTKSDILSAAESYSAKLEELLLESFEPVEPNEEEIKAGVKKVYKKIYK